MKKFLSVLIAFLLFALPALADEIDYSNMSDDELHTVINLARNELLKRELLADEKILLFEKDGVSVYLTGEFGINWMDEIEINTITINNSNSKMDIHPEDLTISVNGWDVSASSDLEAKPGAKKKGTISFDPKGADIKSASEIEELVFYFAFRLEGDKWQHIGPFSVQVNGK